MRYEKLQRIGEGTYGVVYKAKDPVTGETVALKKIALGEDSIPSSSIREITALKQLTHSNVVKLHKTFRKKDTLCLVFEFLPTDLRQFIDLYRVPLQPVLLKKFLYQLLKAIAYCHSNCVLHRDLKPQNLLIDNLFNLKVADFGLSKSFSLPMHTKTREVVTLWYRAPELLLGCEHYGPPIDIWSVGCIFAEMVTGDPLFTGDSEIDQLFRIFQLLGTPQPETAPLLANLPYFKESFPQWTGYPLAGLGLTDIGADLLSRMLALEPAQRITAEEALNHPFFNPE